ncbi:MAG: AmmeMemoRadiSam system protein B [Chloroflexi bacterium]|nr:AmmeMemoRadiSam system protein B [Chloroflexota bacterium]
MDIRPSPIAGTWYPGQPDRLREGVDAMLEAAPALSLPGELIGVIAPHAGHRYSGPTAARAFRPGRDLARQGTRIETVAVLSPMHHPYAAPLLTTGHQAYSTPLGAVPVDAETLQEVDRCLRRGAGPGLTAITNDPEHAVEIELPFLQCALESFSLLPIMLREQTRRVAKALGEALAEVLRDRPALLVASSDLSHFYPQPVAEQLDGEMLARVAAFDPEAVLGADAEERGFACGRGAIAAVLWAARGLRATRVQLLGHTTSGETTGDYQSVVGYGAAAILKEHVP